MRCRFKGSPLKRGIQIAVGLCVAQAVAMAHLFTSNHHLYNVVKAVETAGYQAIPHGAPAGALTGLRPAVYGGLFFTVTLGAVLVVLSLGVRDIFRGLGKKGRMGLALLLMVIWAVIMAKLNGNGWRPYESFYLTLVPLAVWLIPETGPGHGGSSPVRRVKGMAWVLPLIMAAVIFLSGAGPDFFSGIRDVVLLSNPAGRVVNDFYYQYTLYPAQAFAPLSGKDVKICRLSGISDPAFQKRLERSLARYGYFTADGPPDLTITGKAGRLCLSRYGRPALTVPAARFTARPGEILNTFSHKTDDCRFFRAVLKICVLLALPAWYYLFFELLVILSCLSGISEKTSAMAVTVVCSMGCMMIFLPFWFGSGQTVKPAAINDIFISGHWTKQVSALGLIAGQNLEIKRYPAYPGLINSPYIAVRYHLARALGKSKDPATRAGLTALAHDPHPNVVCQALSGLGRRKGPDAQKTMEKILKLSDHWYVQQYAWRNLRRTGWIPEK